MYNVRLFREDGAGNGGGGGKDLPPSLLDVGDPGQANFSSFNDPVVDPPPGETPEQKLVRETAAVTAATAQAALAKEAVNVDGSLKPGYIKNDQGVFSKDTNYTPPADADNLEEGLNEDGTLKEGYIKDKNGKIVIDPAYEKIPDSPTAIFEAVEKLTGIKVEVAYPDGVDADTPEGLVIRDQAIRDQGAVQFENYIKQHKPRAYAYMLHLENGGTDDEFFEDGPGFTLPVKEDLDKSADLQASMYKYELIALNGLDDASAQALVDMAVKDNKLKEKSEAAFTRIDKVQKQQITDIEKFNTQRKQQRDNAIGTITNTVAKAIAENMNFVVPDAERPAFQKFVLDNLRYDTDSNKFFLVQDFGTETLKETLEALFFQHKKGDLSKIITRQAKTKAAQGIRLRLKGTEGPGTSGGNANNTTVKHIPLGDLNPPGYNPG